MSEPQVSALYIYPVKSCRGIRLDVSELEAFGLKHDRRWMVVDNDGVMLTQRKLARMCLIQPELTQSGVMLKTSAMNDISIDIPVAAKLSRVKVWDDVCQAHDAGDEAANWLSEFLQRECRLVYFPDNEFRQVDETYAQAGDKTAFSDGFPLLLISQASLDDLNQRMEKPLGMNRFRPNIVVQGCSAFAEDAWKKISIGNIELQIVKPCSRCVIPSINIETAEREEEPTKTLLSYRRKNNKIYFGQNVIANTVGRIQVGMPVVVLE